MGPCFSLGFVVQYGSGDSSAIRAYLRHDNIASALTGQMLREKNNKGIFTTQMSLRVIKGFSR